MKLLNKMSGYSSSSIKIINNKNYERDLNNQNKNSLILPSIYHHKEIILIIKL